MISALISNSWIKLLLNVSAGISVKLGIDNEISFSQPENIFEPKTWFWIVTVVKAVQP